MVEPTLGEFDQGTKDGPGGNGQLATTPAAATVDYHAIAADKAVSSYNSMSRLLLLGMVGLTVFVISVGAMALLTLSKTHELSTQIAVLQEKLVQVPSTIAPHADAMESLVNELNLLQAKLDGTVEHIANEAGKIAIMDKRSTNLETSIQHIETDMVELTEQGEAIDRHLRQLLAK